MKGKAGAWAESNEVSKRIGKFVHLYERGEKEIERGGGESSSILKIQKGYDGVKRKEPNRKSRETRVHSKERGRLPDRGERTGLGSS